jgi:hypothetical protein
MLTRISSTPSLNGAARARRLARPVGLILAVCATTFTAACSDSTSSHLSDFLNGTSSDHQIGLVVNSGSRSLTLFQHGSPTTIEQIPFGSSTDITPVGLSIQGHYAIVPLGNTASVAYVNLNSQTIQRYFLFPSGNTTGSAFVNDTTVLLANTNTNVVGRVTVGQASDSVTDTVTVPGGPTAIAMAGGYAFVVSSNLDENYDPAGPGIITIIDPATMHVVSTLSSGGDNSTSATVGPDGLVYVVNTGNYATQGSVTIVDPSTRQVVTTVSNMGIGTSEITFSSNGLAYISAYFTGTIVWNSATRQFVRDADHPLCAPSTSGCRGSGSSTVDAAGNVYQAFYGSASQNLPSRVFIYSADTYALTDSLSSVANGPSTITMHTF